MTNTQVSTARKFATAAFAGFVALSLMVPTQLAFAEYYVGDSDAYDGAADNSGEGSEGGTWDYAADGQEMTLVDYVGGSIIAVNQDLNVQLEGDSTIKGSLGVNNGNLTVTGDDSVYGLDKPSITFEASETGFGSGGLWADEGDLTIQDANVYFDAQYGYIEAYDGDLSIINSATWRGDANDDLEIWSYGTKGGDMLLKGSEINATEVYALGTLTIDNTNLTVLPGKEAQDMIDAGAYGDVPWVTYAVTAVKGIELVGEDNGEVIAYTDEDGDTWYYLYTGDDNKVELKASETPAYWGPQGMPKTGDALPLAGFGIAIAAAGLLGAYSLRRTAISGKHVK